MYILSNCHPRERATLMNERTTVQIVEAIADEKNVDPSELDYRLYDHIETDGLGLLTNRDTDSWTLSFEVPDGTVTITADGDIRLDFPGDDELPRQSAGD